MIEKSTQNTKSIADQMSQQKQKLDDIGLFARWIAHDFNNTISGIKIAAEMIKKDMLDEQKRDTFLSMIIDSVDEASELTENLLLFGRRGLSDSMYIDINQITDAATQNMRESLGDNVNLDIKLCEHTAVINGNENHLLKMIMNMALNAGQAMPEGGELKVRTKVVELTEKYCQKSLFEITPGKFITLEMQDTGSGILPENIARIFEPFFTTKEPGKGPGLGLTTAYGIIQQHKGAVNVYSRPEEGACFSVLFPIIDEYADEITGDLEKDPDTCFK